MNLSASLKVQGLSVQAGTTPLLSDVSFELRSGEMITIIGESGAGKSLLAQAIIGNLPAALTGSGYVELNGSSSRIADAPARRPLWGHSLALLPQEPGIALDPLMRLKQQLSEVFQLVRGHDSSTAGRHSVEQLENLGLGNAARLYPWQMSGGMAQRAAASVALAAGARILLADEPTKGLDSGRRKQTVELFRQLLDNGACVLVVTHDLRIALELGGQLIVLQAGQVVEQGDARSVLANPKHSFTRKLIEANPANWSHQTALQPGAAVLHARSVAKGFGGKTLFENIDLQLNAGDRLVVQGPSGIGKSTFGNLLLGLVRPDRGEIRRAEGLPLAAFQKLYQDPVASFAPGITLRQSLTDLAQRHRCDLSGVVERLNRIGVAEAVLERRPSEVSGGELQRVALARVLMIRPALLFADEPTSRLDPVSQREALRLMLESIDEIGAALLLVTHDDDIARSLGTRFLKFSGLSDDQLPGSITP